MERILSISSLRTGHSLIYNNIWHWLKASGIDREIAAMNQTPTAQQLQELAPIGVLLVTRSLTNVIASLFEKYRGTDILTNAFMDSQMNLWNVIAKEGFGETDLIPIQKRVVVFDEFVESQAYRQELCIDIGGTYHEDVLGTLVGKTGGTFFADMNIKERWNQIPETRKQQFYDFLKRNKTALRTYKRNFELTIAEQTIVDNLIG